MLANMGKFQTPSKKDNKPTCEHYVQFSNAIGNTVRDGFPIRSPLYADVQLEYVEVAKSDLLVRLKVCSL